MDYIYPVVSRGANVGFCMITYFLCLCMMIDEWCDRPFGNKLY